MTGIKNKIKFIFLKRYILLTYTKTGKCQRQSEYDILPTNVNNLDESILKRIVSVEIYFKTKKVPNTGIIVRNEGCKTLSFIKKIENKIKKIPSIAK